VDLCGVTALRQHKAAQPIVWIYDFGVNLPNVYIASVFRGTIFDSCAGKHNLQCSCEHPFLLWNTVVSVSGLPGDDPMAWLPWFQRRGGAV